MLFRLEPSEVSKNQNFFPGGRGGICSPSAVSSNFRSIWISAGLKRDGRVKPRAYDFKHHFSCANIMHWSEEDRGTFDAFTRDNIKEYVTWLKGKGFSAKTINLKLTAIRSFLKYCSKEDFELRGVYTDACSVKKIGEEKKPIEYLSPEATSAILAAYNSTTAKHRRNRMMLILLYDSEARVQESSDTHCIFSPYVCKEPLHHTCGQGTQKP